MIEWKSKIAYLQNVIFDTSGMEKSYSEFSSWMKKNVMQCLKARFTRLLLISLEINNNLVNINIFAVIIVYQNICIKARCAFTIVNILEVNANTEISLNSTLEKDVFSAVFSRRNVAITLFHWHHKKKPNWLSKLQRNAVTYYSFSQIIKFTLWLFFNFANTLLLNKWINKI